MIRVTVSIGSSSTPSDGATDWIPPNMPIWEAMAEPVEQEGADADEEGVGPCTRNRCKGGIDLTVVLALRTWICNPMPRAAASR
jgi:hypothetical protein